MKGQAPSAAYKNYAAQLTNDIQSYHLTHMILTGDDLPAAIILSQIIYWSNWSEKVGREGWFYRSYEEWYNRMHLSKKVVSRALDALKHIQGVYPDKDCALIETKTAFESGVRVLHYRLAPGFYDAVEHFFSPDKENPQTELSHEESTQTSLSSSEESTQTSLSLQLDTIPLKESSLKEELLREGTPQNSETKPLSETKKVEDTPTEAATQKEATPQEDLPSGQEKEKKPRVCTWAPLHDALLEAFSIDKASITRTADSVYWKVAHELHLAKFPIEQVPALYRHVAQIARENQWGKWTAVALSKYAPDYLSSRKENDAALEEVNNRVWLSPEEAWEYDAKRYGYSA